MDGTVSCKSYQVNIMKFEIKWKLILGWLTARVNASWQIVCWSHEGRALRLGPTGPEHYARQKQRACLAFRMPNGVPDLECQNVCQNICQTEGHVKYQNICQTVRQNVK